MKVRSVENPHLLFGAKGSGKCICNGLVWTSMVPPVIIVIIIIIIIILFSIFWCCVIGSGIPREDLALNWPQVSRTCLNSEKQKLVKICYQS